MSIVPPIAMTVIPGCAAVVEGCAAVVEGCAAVIRGCAAAASEAALALRSSRPLIATKWLGWGGGRGLYQEYILSYLRVV